MGVLYAQRAAAEGAAAIALWDLDEATAADLANQLTANGTQAMAIGVDVSNRENIAQAAARTREFMGDPDIIINNAGIVRGTTFWEHDPVRDIEATMRVNTLGPMWIVREFLPAMIADTARPKRIMNVASAAGTLANPHMSVYAASKWALLGWSESLRLELEKEKHRHILVTTFCPSYIDTGMFEGVRAPLLTPIMTPQVAVDAAWRGMLRGTPVVSKPWTVKLGMAVRGVLPTRAWDFVADRIFGVYSSMDHFTGRGRA
ncbi:SDR family NAD(P)-dependent oxidoreductase [Schaalia canis]|uniref:SDR family NAD(P)-dependent oxidoreductase n=2 Tax=Schaalia canis TaxID=100469 RepID=A0A3P1SFJ2_9ACTO|nr:SDR family NAD(P)-dependent oxidoreductase [Schaalia canis]